MNNDKGLKLMSRNIKNHQSVRGFTLIELLIVVAIIGVLATLLMANFIGVRQRARDAQRKSDLRQIQSALEIYRSDNGLYPTSDLVCNNPLASGGSTYMKKIPCDPNGTSVSYSYSSLDGTDYTLYACLENSSDSQKDDSAESGCSVTHTSFTVSSP